MTYDVKNQGGQSSSSIIFTDYFLSIDDTLNLDLDVPIYSPSDEILKTPIEPLEFGETFNTPNVDIHIPSYMEEGNYYLLLRVDCDNFVSPESSEDNNVFAVPIFINNPEPDFIIQNTEVQDTITYIDSTLIVSFEVANIGEVLSNPTSLNIYISTDTLIDENDINLTNYAQNLTSILPDENISFENINITIPEIELGNYYLLLFADTDSIISENNEDNNLSYFSFIVRDSLSDLNILNETINNTNIFLGENVEISFDIENIGGVFADSTSLSFYISEDENLDLETDILLTNIHIDTLQIDSILNFNDIFIDLSSILVGEYYIFGIADVNNLINELDETNNQFSFIINIEEEVLELVDLNLKNTLIAPNALNVGQTFYASAEIENLGNVPTNPSLLKYYLSDNFTLEVSSDILLGETVVPSINANGIFYIINEPVLIPETIEAGDYYILFSVDTENEIAETNEDNNLLYEYLTALPETIKVVDLVVMSININSSPPIYLNGEINIDLAVKNIGNLGAGENLTRIYLSEDISFQNTDIYIGESIIDTLEMEETKILDLTLNIPENINTGSWYLLAITDFNNDINESSEDNNLDYQSIYLEYLPSDLPDLQVEELQTNINTVEANESIEISCSVKNYGENRANSSLLMYYISEDNILDISQDMQIGGDIVGELSKNDISQENILTTIPYIAQSGEWYIIASADALFEIDEDLEDNNNSFIKINVLDFDNVENIDDIFELKLYPNPTKDIVQIYFENNFKDTEITIFNNLGQKIWFENTNKSFYSSKFDFFNYEKGIYFIEIKNQSNKIIKKLIAY